MNKKAKVLAAIIAAMSLVGCTKKEQQSAIEPTPTPRSDVPFVDADREKAQEVMDLISALSEESSVDEIEAVVDRYNDLTDRQKNMVENYDVLQERIGDIARKEMVQSINEMIDALTESSSERDIVEVQSAYARLGAEHGPAWQQRVDANKIAKLTGLIRQIVQNRVNEFLSLDNDSSASLAKKALLVDFIDGLVSGLNVTFPEGYESAKEEIRPIAGAVKRDDFLGQGSASEPYFREGKSGAFHRGYNAWVGSSHYIDFDPKLNYTFQLAFSSQGDSWSKEKTLGLFMKTDVPNDEIMRLIPSGAWSHESIGTRTVVDESEHLYFYEFDLKDLPASFTQDSYIQIYFRSPVAHYEVTDFVFFHKQIERAEELIRNANAADANSDRGMVNFALLSREIDDLITESDGELLEGYSDYLSKKQSLASSVSILWDGDITTDDGDDYPKMKEEASQQYGRFHTYRYGSSKSGVVNAFAIAKDENWSGHSRLAAFIGLSDATSEEVSLVIDNVWDEPFGVAIPIEVDAQNHIYYVQFDISALPSTMTGNPVISIGLSNSTNVIRCTDLVAIE